ncbi:MAG: peptidase S10 [Propionibacteriaceae bacterium]|jgi:carboxypeptidase C (cathepsin A)|nr:peptidase S10 [Propionibacteriaceae bacterium]
MSEAITARGRGVESPPPVPDPNTAERLQSVQTNHVLKTATRDLHYSASAGYLDLVGENIGGESAEEPNTKARVFLTQYLASAPEDIGPGSDGINPRPVIFIFNGGPGSSSVWLHLGLFGPRLAKAVAEDQTTPLPPPYKLIDNPESPLAYADLVLIDPVSTGYSRVVGGEKADQFHGVEEDVESVTEIIRLWVTRHNRWASPLFIAGESYGVLRGSAVTERLARRHGLYLRGLILISSPITPGPMRFEPGAILSSHAFLPSYAAVAWYHGKHPGRTLAEVVQEAEEFADNKYLWALNQGNRLSGPERAEVVSTLARLTGLSAAYLQAVNLIIEKQRFYAELLRGEGRVVGEIDGRFTGWNPDGAGERAVEDPTDQVLKGAFAGAINHYLRSELGYRNDLSYEIITDRVRPWRGPKNPFQDGTNTLGALSAALRRNRNLKVLYQLGYYDLCTPYWGAVSDVAKLQVPPELAANVRVSIFEAGHMIYIDERSRLAELADIERFVTEASAAESPDQPAGNVR